MCYTACTLYCQCRSITFRLSLKSPTNGIAAKVALHTWLVGCVSERRHRSSANLIKMSHAMLMQFCSALRNNSLKHGALLMQVAVQPFCCTCSSMCTSHCDGCDMTTILPLLTSSQQLCCKLQPLGKPCWTLIIPNLQGLYRSKLTRTPPRFSG